ILNSFVGIMAIQIALTDLLRVLELEPDFIIGHSTGENCCAYADGVTSLEQSILLSLYRGLASCDNKIVKGAMAAIGLGYRKIVGMLPPDIEVACHNSADSSTISGPADSVEKFVKQLVAQGIFAKEVNCSDIPYHTKLIKPIGDKLTKYLE